jgi:hypothetical protein
MAGAQQFILKDFPNFDELLDDSNVTFLRRTFDLMELENVVTAVFGEVKILESYMSESIRGPPAWAHFLPGVGWQKTELNGMDARFSHQGSLFKVTKDRIEWHGRSQDNGSSQDIGTIEAVKTSAQWKGMDDIMEAVKTIMSKLFRCDAEFVKCVLFFVTSESPGSNFFHDTMGEDVGTQALVAVFSFSDRFLSLVANSRAVHQPHFVVDHSTITFALSDADR